VKTMPAPSSAKPVARKRRSIAKRKVAAGKGPSFGAAVRKYAGIVHSGIGDLSTREGFGD
jgi:hypothetical protein